MTETCIDHRKQAATEIVERNEDEMEATKRN